MMIYNMKEVINTVSVLILCILLIRRIFKGKIGSRFQYALWFLVVLRLMIPVSIPVHLPIDVFNQYHLLEQHTDDMVEQLNKPIQVTVNSRNRIYHLLAEDSVETAKDGLGEFEGEIVFMIGHLRYSWLDVLGVIWKVGMVLLASWILIINMIFSRRLKRERRVLELSDETKQTLRTKLPQKIAGIYGGTRIYIVEGLTSPCLYGLPGREAVYLTPDIADDTDRLSHVLCHELCHKRHGDSLWGILRGLLVTVYWFHPLVWAAAFLSKRDCELACDETALILLGEGERIAYGETLLSIITRKGRISDLICTATTMTGSGKNVKERIGFIAKKPQVVGTAVALAAVLVTVVFICAFIRSSERIKITAFGKEMNTVTGADMQIPLPESVREVCGQVREDGKNDVIIYHVNARREVGRFSHMSLKDTLQMIDEGREVVPLGDYGDNYFLKAYLGVPVSVTMHTYTPAEQGDPEAVSGMLMHEEIVSSESVGGADGVPGVDSNVGTEHKYESGEDSSAETEHVYVPGTDSNTDTEYVEEDDTTYLLDDKVDYLPNEQITTTVYPPKEVNVDELHTGCYVYVKADYGNVKEAYLEEMEQLNRALESAAEGVVVLSLNGEIREELLDDLTKNRTPYVGDNSKVGALVSALPIPPTLNYKGELSLQTVTEPYSLRFEYEMTRDSMDQEDLDMLYFNAAMLFYTIGNLDEITFYIKHPTGSATSRSLQVYYRDDMEAAFNELLQINFGNEQDFREGLEDLHTKVVKQLHSQT